MYEKESRLFGFVSGAFDDDACMHAWLRWHCKVLSLEKQNELQGSLFKISSVFLQKFSSIRQKFCCQPRGQ